MYQTHHWIWLVHPAFAAVQALEKYGRAGAAQPQLAEAGGRMSVVPRDCSYDPLKCERIHLLVLATAGMFHAPALLSAAGELQVTSCHICGEKIKESHQC